MFTESQARVNRCLDMLNDEQVWHRPNPASNAVGNLVLHLSGNIRQWVIAALGGQADDRRRDAEFAEDGFLTVDALRQHFNATLDEANVVIAGLEPASLGEPRRVQGFDESTLSILVHVAEHLSYHTGQIAYITKMLTAEPTGFYAGQKLDATGRD